MIQRAVQLDVVQPAALPSGQQIQRTDLLEHECLELLGRQGHLAPSEGAGHSRMGS